MDFFEFGDEGALSSISEKLYLLSESEMTMTLGGLVLVEGAVDLGVGIDTLSISIKTSVNSISENMLSIIRYTNETWIDMGAIGQVDVSHFMSLNTVISSNIHEDLLKFL